MTDHERHDRQPVRLVAAEHVDVRVLLPRADRTADELGLAGLDHLRSDGLFQLEHESGPDRLDDRRCAGFLAVFDLGVVVVLGGADVADRAATGHVRAPGW